MRRRVVIVAGLVLSPAVAPMVAHADAAQVPTRTMRVPCASAAVDDAPAAADAPAPPETQPPTTPPTTTAPPTTPPVETGPDHDRTAVDSCRRRRRRPALPEPPTDHVDDAACRPHREPPAAPADRNAGHAGGPGRSPRRRSSRRRPPRPRPPPRRRQRLQRPTTTPATTTTTATPPRCPPPTCRSSRKAPSGRAPTAASTSPRPCTTTSTRTACRSALRWRRSRFLESGNNYQAQAAKASASGAYQIIDQFWNNYGGYPRAYLAPPAVQDQFAYEQFVQILKRNGNNLAAIPVSWYYPAALTRPGS